MKTGENVALTVNFPCIKFIEQSHQDKCVEDDREMFGWPTRANFGETTPTIDIQQYFTCVEQARTDSIMLLHALIYTKDQMIKERFLLQLQPLCDGRIKVINGYWQWARMAKRRIRCESFYQDRKIVRLPPRLLMVFCQVKSLFDPFYLYSI